MINFKNLNLDKIITKMVLLFSLLTLVAAILSSAVLSIIQKEFLSCIFLIVILVVLFLNIKKLNKVYSLLDIVKNKFFHIPLIIITVILPRMLWYNFVKIDPYIDFRRFHNLANLINTSDLISDSYFAIFPHTFGFSYILSFLYKIFGGGIITAITLNTMSALGSSVILYFIGKEIYNWKVGIIAAVIAALFPQSIYYNNFVLTEPFFIFLLLLTLFVFIKFLNSKNIIYKFILLVVISFLCSFINFIRPFGILLLLTFLFVVILKLIRKYKGLIFLINILPIVGLLLISYISFSTVLSSIIFAKLETKTAKFPVGFNMYIGSNLKSFGMWNKDDAKVLTKYKELDPQELHNLLIKETFKRYKKQGVHSFILIPVKYVIIWGSTDSGVIYYMKECFNKDSILDINKYSFLLSMLSNIYYIIVVIYMYISLKISYKENFFNTKLTLFYILIIGTVSTHTIVEVYGRYNMPVMIICSLFAAKGIDDVEKLVGNKKS